MPDSGLLTDLRAIVGDDGLLTDAPVRERVDANGTAARASVLVRPRNTEEVSAVLRMCHARSQPVVPQGGLTGLVDGATTRESDLILSLERMHRIERVDVAGRTIRVEAGAILQRVQEEAEQHDLMFPLDLGARGSCTIGGNISTNAGGVRVLRYGMMRGLVLGLEAVLADGTVLSSLNRMLKNNSGYDLKQLFIGSEGTLGVVTRADLRLVPRPRSAGTALVACDSFQHLVKLLHKMDAQMAGQLSAFEALWPEYYEIATKPPATNAAVLSHGHGMYGLVETLGADPQEDEARLERVLEEAIEEELITDAAIAKSEQERRMIWEIREDVWQVKHQFGAACNFDVSLAIEDMAAYLQSLRQDVTKRLPGARVFGFGHIADGNLHVIVATGRDDEAARHEAEQAVYEPLRKLGGSISAEHGIGLERKMYLGISRSPAEIATMKALKAALDPRGILNPGKIFE